MKEGRKEERKGRNGFWAFVERGEERPNIKSQHVKMNHGRVDRPYFVDFESKTYLIFALLVNGLQQSN